jgi:hypothetical protein
VLKVLLRVRQSGKARRMRRLNPAVGSVSFRSPAAGCGGGIFFFVNSSGRAKDAEVEYNVLLGED